ncbi:hypothetical protein NDU88_008089 [Pleurodeles waltl]|uniref:Uncharacterized protein n=1 Tax=Pleurodeles waltl TaxID=8319 RepID=A0AAV7SUP5_PLEWA|nr:hypothetical protein NDU88_008089 [Pleurodeles waltl]
MLGQRCPASKKRIRRSRKFIKVWEPRLSNAPYSKGANVVNLEVPGPLEWELFNCIPCQRHGRAHTDDASRSSRRVNRLPGTMGVLVPWEHGST